ncbi:MAG: lactonase family protein [Solirubrobacteraceae bacterium]
MSSPLDRRIALWVGCYTSDMDGEGQGIVALGREANGSLGPLGAPSPVASPSFLALHPSLPVLYAVSEGEQTVGAYRYAAGGSLSALGTAVAAGPYVCHVAADPEGKFLVASCWGDGSVVLVEVEPDGSLGARHAGAASVDPYGQARQSRAHACLMLGNGQAVTTDVGHDLLRFWQFSAGDGLEQLGTERLPVGSGPRHLAQSSRGIVYVVTEYSAEVALLYPVARGPGRVALELQSMLPISPRGALPGDAAAEVCLDADERHLYVGVRGSNRICTLQVHADGTTTPLEEVDCGGLWPRHHCVDQQRLIVALERSNAIAIFSLQPDGRVTGAPRLVPVGSPSCVLPHR